MSEEQAGASRAWSNYIAVAVLAVLMVSIVIEVLVMDTHHSQEHLEIHPQ